ncbi:basic amino acid ABC transporter substrate-binding protein [Glaciimonas immobilis]|uniref:Polar amino acid transport system substrate-binding protein n=1 Tax=Glaciimonas immobilis TaxID=728004 RepID=A0A840RQP3_9BURK|nr:basic amino acid ABC transporter substrate-binding protein [Glaciimonas immobilis]KAF3997572.1 basic amino acid ABC transporter substrate-binding protein [Glaciimonas immobilis]MBB5200737.1 polar amino acid transport system substrate-binding protein [Glaciimonas immobilis]
MKKLSKAFICVASSVFLLTACGKKESKEAQVAPARTPIYTVGAEATFAPFESQNEQKEIVGFDVDLMNAIADKAGFKVKFVNTPFEGIFNFLAQGDRDMLASAITITDERKLTVDFSDPYYQSTQLIVVPKNSTVTKFRDLEKLTVGVQSATTGDEVVQKLLGKSNPKIKRLESATLALKELEGGGVDAVVLDTGPVKNYVKNNPTLGFRFISDPEFPKEYYGIAVKKGNIALLTKVNHGLAAVKADGTYDKIFKKYFADEAR